MIKIPSDMVTGCVHETISYGSLTVVKYINAHKVFVQFTSTKFTTWTRSDHVRDGRVKDQLHPFVCGVGFMGVGDYSRIANPKTYRIWNSMLSRCYSEKEQLKCPTYIGCSVTKEWHNFQNFAQWYNDNYPVGKDNYQLDKDIKIKGNKVYGPDTCLFVSHRDNMIEAQAKHYTFKSPEGVVVNVYNLEAFCRDNNLTPQGMGVVHSGKQSNHKGWTKWEVEK